LALALGSFKRRPRQVESGPAEAAGAAAMWGTTALRQRHRGSRSADNEHSVRE